MDRDNRGFTLVEIIIVIAIIGILMAVLIGGSGYMAGSAAQSLANSVKTSIGETRIKTMGKQETALYIYKNASDQKYYKQYLIRINGTWKEPEAPEVIGKHHPVMKYKAGGVETTINDGDGIIIGFDRKTGKEADPTVLTNYNNMNNHFEVSSATGELISGSQSADLKAILCENIEITGGGRTYNIIIYPATGKVTLE